MTPWNWRGRQAPAVTLAKLVSVVVFAACAAGCGIRTTSVPVDAGPAPSRMPCQVAQKDVSTQARPGIPVRIYLVCSSGLAPVERTARISEEKVSDSRIKIAQALLDELRARPSAAEEEAGFLTYLQGPLVVSPPGKGDPADTLRLSRQPEDMQTTELAQIVCTFAESDATDGEVVLAGPGEYPPRGYRCTDGTKSRPDAAVPTLGPLPSVS